MVFRAKQPHGTSWAGIARQWPLQLFLPSGLPNHATLPQPRKANVESKERTGKQLFISLWMDDMALPAQDFFCLVLS